MFQAPFQFFDTVRLYFRIFLSKGRSFFLMFCDRMDVEKSESVPLLARQFGRLGFLKVFQNFFL